MKGNSRPHRARHVRRIVVAAALGITVVVMWNLFAGIENWKRDLTSNQARLSEESTDPLLRPLTLQLPMTQVATQIRRWAEEDSQWSLESERRQDESIELDLVHRTRWLGFKDDVRVRLREIAGSTRVEANSQSRIGKGDLGQNPRNLRELVRELKKSG